MASKHDTKVRSPLPAGEGIVVLRGGHYEGVESPDRPLVCGCCDSPTSLSSVAVGRTVESESGNVESSCGRDHIESRSSREGVTGGNDSRAGGGGGDGGGDGDGGDAVPITERKSSAILVGDCTDRDNENARHRLPNDHVLTPGGWFYFGDCGPPDTRALLSDGSCFYLHSAVLFKECGVLFRDYCHQQPLSHGLRTLCLMDFFTASFSSSSSPSSSSSSSSSTRLAPCAEPKYQPSVMRVTASLQAILLFFELMYYPPSPLPSAGQQRLSAITVCDVARCASALGCEAVLALCDAYLSTITHRIFTPPSFAAFTGTSSGSTAFAFSVPVPSPTPFDADRGWVLPTGLFTKSVAEFYVYACHHKLVRCAHLCRVRLVDVTFRAETNVDMYYTLSDPSKHGGKPVRYNCMEQTSSRDNKALYDVALARKPAF